MSAFAHHGFLMAHRPNMKHLPQEKSNIIELNFSKVTKGKEYWQQAYNLPEWSISMMYGSAGNKEILGNFVGLYPQIHFPLIGGKQPVLRLNLGIGGGYFNTIYDRVQNHKNNAISNYVNGMVTFKLESRLPLWKDKMYWHNALSFIHFSNGSSKVPNAGINLCTFNTGLSYRFGEKENYYHQGEIPQKKQNDDISIIAILSAGRSEIVPADGQKFLSLVNTFSFQKRIGEKNLLSAGTDIMYGGSAEKKMKNKNLPYNGLSDALQAGIHVGYVFDMDKINLIINNGIYLYDPLKHDGIFYHRIGMRFYLSDNLLANISLRTHFAKAEHFELGLAYKIFGK